MFLKKKKTFLLIGIKVFGIDQVSKGVPDDQYEEFFRLCDAYIRKWKSKNTSKVEMLFLQLLSYYVEKFNAEKFAISIKSRIPVLKNTKKIQKYMWSCKGNRIEYFFYC